MRIKYALLVSLMCFFFLGFSQSTIISLIDTLRYTKKVSFLARENVMDVSQFSLSDLSDSSVNATTFSVAKLQPSNFLWKQQIDDSDYYSLFFTKTIRPFGMQYLLASEKDMAFQALNEKSIDLSDGSFVLSFEHKELNESLNIAVNVELNSEKEFLFYPYQLFSGTIELEDTLIRFQIWPFQHGPIAKVGADSSFSIMKTDGRLEMGEDFIINGQVLKFSKFDYINKRVQLDFKSITDGVIYGYKEGTTLAFWEDKTALWEELNLNAERPTLLYFGGSWCPPCLEELPRLKAISNLCMKKNIEVLSIAVESEDTAEQGRIYLDENDFPGGHLLEVLGKENELHRQLNVFSYPTYIFVDSDGKILFRADTRGARDKHLHGFITDYLSAE